MKHPLIFCIYLFLAFWMVSMWWGLSGRSYFRKLLKKTTYWYIVYGHQEGDASVTSKIFWKLNHYDNFFPIVQCQQDIKKKHGTDAIVLSFHQISEKDFNKL